MLAKPARNQACTAGNLQNVTWGLCRQALRKIGRESVEPDRAQAIVVILRTPNIWAGHYYPLKTEIEPPSRQSAFKYNS